MTTDKPKSYPPFGPRLRDFVFFYIVGCVVIMTPLMALALWLVPSGCR